ncbi:hypothetical protein ES703_38952 [subsurface metagenome]
MLRSKTSPSKGLDCNTTESTYYGTDPNPTEQNEKTTENKTDEIYFR